MANTIYNVGVVVWMLANPKFRGTLSSARNVAYKALEAALCDFRYTVDRASANILLDRIKTVFQRFGVSQDLITKWESSKQDGAAGGDSSYPTIVFVVALYRGSL